MSKFVDFLKLARLRGGYNIFLRRQFDSGRVFTILIKLARAYRRLILHKPKVCGVIGSLGKTTTTRTVRAALGGPVRQPFYSNYGSSLACNVLAIRPWDRHAVLEAGIARPGMMDANVYLLKPDMAVATSVAWEHFRSFRSQEDIRAEKVKMVRGLPSSGWAVLNGDDPNVMWMAGETKAAVITFGFGPECDVRMHEFTYDWPRGMKGRVTFRDQTWDVSTRMFGRHFWYPVLAGLAAAVAWKAEIPDAIARLAELSPTPKRFNPIPLEGDVWLIDDTCKGGYDSWLTALQALEQISAPRKIVVFGDIEDPPGNRAETYQEVGDGMGRAANAAILFGFGDDLRKARAAAGRSGIAAENMILLKSSDYNELIRTLHGMIQPGDVILVKGRSAYRLERVVLALQKRTVTCPLKICNVKVFTCGTCPMLERHLRDFQNHFIYPYFKQ